MPLNTDTTDVFSIRPYVSYVAPCAGDPIIRRGNASTNLKKCSAVGVSRNTMMPTSERRQIEDLIATISYARSFDASLGLSANRDDDTRLQSRLQSQTRTISRRTSAAKSGASGVWFCDRLDVNLFRTFPRLLRPFLKKNPA